MSEPDTATLRRDLDALTEANGALLRKQCELRATLRDANDQVFELLDILHALRVGDARLQDLATGHRIRVAAGWGGPGAADLRAEVDGLRQLLRQREEDDIGRHTATGARLTAIEARLRDMPRRPAGRSG